MRVSVGQLHIDDWEVGATVLSDVVPDPVPVQCREIALQVPTDFNNGAGGKLKRRRFKFLPQTGSGLLPTVLPRSRTAS